MGNHENNKINTIYFEDFPYGGFFISVFIIAFICLLENGASHGICDLNYVCETDLELSVPGF